MLNYTDMQLNILVKYFPTLEELSGIHLSWLDKFSQQHWQPDLQSLMNTVISASVNHNQALVLLNSYNIETTLFKL